MLVYIFLATLLTVLADPVPTGGATCTSDLDCGGVNGGSCANGTCFCPSNRGNKDCSYTRKSRSFAFGIQWLWLISIGGIGRFVLGHTATGAGQLVLGLSSIIFICVVCCIQGAAILSKSKKGSIVSMILIGILSFIFIGAILAWLGWVIADLVMIANGTLMDANGYSTTPDI